ncbi:adenosine receptor A2a-like [Rhopilema esculentum]|uniref:adenosine receptor A2a-like n=1 Tax=Rhopilema esculentum TaxID=499914 RepID=UPI0031D64E48|eukprot:gene9511-17254_t
MVDCFPDTWAPKSLSHFTAAASLVLCIIITTGNLLIILAVIIDPLKKLRTPFSYFLINLAISDLIVGLVTMPVSYDVHSDEASGHIPKYKVTLIHVSYFVSSTASVLSLGALSVDRFVAIRWPIRYRKRLSMLRCAFMSFAIWLFSGAVSMVYLKIGYINHLMVFVHLSVLLTFILLVVTYREVYKAFRRQANELRAFQNPGNIQNTTSQVIDQTEFRRVRTEKKVTRAFLYILGLFICCYLPAIVMIYILQFCETCSCDLRHILRDLQFILVSVNSAMNPFVCTIRLGPFRRSIIAVILCKKFRQNKYAIRNESARGMVNHGASNKESSEETV